MKFNYQKDYEKYEKSDSENNNVKKTEETGYSYYSNVLKTPFATVNELKDAEAVHFAELKAKESKAIQKKLDAKVVEEAFRALNAARRSYKDDLQALAAKYSEDLLKLKETFEAARNEVKTKLANAEETYSESIKAFTDKYPEGYHLTLKDGDFETTISGSSNAIKSAFETNRAFQMIDWLFNV